MMKDEAAQVDLMGRGWEGDENWEYGDGDCRPMQSG